LVALLLAFSFSLASQRFDLRSGPLLKEADSIGTTYLRTGLLPERSRSCATTQLLRDYLDARIALYTTRSDTLT
jgi:hypothetical protein